jgi:hypothetical protein
MKRPILILAACAALATHAADVDFNGRWDIQQLRDNPDKAWWLEVSGAGTPHIKGKFIGFPGGDLNEIKDLKIENGALTFTDGRPKPQQYEAKFVASSGHLDGKMTGPTGEPIAFAGYRAPEIRDHDDGTWLKSDPIPLFDAKDLTGWTGLGTAQNLGWTVEDGKLKSTGHAQNLITTSNTMSRRRATAASAFADATKSRSRTITANPSNPTSTAPSTAASNRSPTPAVKRANGKPPISASWAATSP